MPDPSAADSSTPVSPLATPPCPTCEGDGWIIDHEEACYEAGDCVGCGGVQRRCDDPRGHADRCTRCDGNGQTWDPRVHGNVVSCQHCTGGWVYRNDEAPDPFTEYLSQPCDRCDRTATHNQNGRRLCNEHLDPDLPAFARND